MDGTIVFIFLLDHLPENILNTTLDTIEVTHTVYSNTSTCDYAITDPLLQVISRELEALVIPKWLTNEKQKENSKEPLKTVFDTNKVQQNSVEVNEDGINADETEKLYKNKDLLDEELKHSKFSRQTPLLAAIFESLSNITAQTCAGTVVGPQWVLTDASCVNLLSTLEAQSNRVSEKSVYTIIINSTDPLRDGSAHNVTEIHLHPNATQSRHSELALLKIQPAVATDEVPLIGTFDDRQHVTVYGWITKKMEEPGRDSISRTALQALVLSHEHCSAYYNVSVDATEMCLTATDDGEAVGQLSWGGPVVTETGGIVAVTRGESRAPLAAWPLAGHLTWIHDTAFD